MRIFFILGASMIAALGVQGQGTVFFQNGITSAIYIDGTAPANRATSATIGAQTGNGSTGVIDVGLVWGTSADNVNTLQGIENIGSYAGIVNGGSAASYFPLIGTNPGDVAFIQIFCWDSSYGNSLAGMDACIGAGGLFVAASGTSGVYGSIGTPLSFTLGATPGPGTPIFGIYPGVFGKSDGLFNNMLLVTSPEPATVVLGGLGAVVFALFRRRK
jgi:hypothetical protein